MKRGRCTGCNDFFLRTKPKYFWRAEGLVPPVLNTGVVGYQFTSQKDVSCLGSLVTIGIESCVEDTSFKKQYLKTIN